MSLQTKNTIWSILQHLVTIACGLVLPREILAYYGSEMNGVVHSISQFLSYTVILDLGISAVIPASLYQPLAEGNREQISAILVSGRRVFRRVAVICVGYILILLLLFPQLTGISSSWLLIAVLGIGTIFGYVWGNPERYLIISDQKGYVVYSLATVSCIINTVVQVALIRSGSSLAFVKAAGVAISIVQICLICLYVRKHYSVDWKIKYDKEPISQKWNGIAQHVAYFVLENTDIVLLTLFTTFREVSVYSVYFMVISGVRRIFSSITYSVQPKLGEIKAKGDQPELNRYFASFEKWIHVSTVVIFGSLGLMLIPFVEAYTDGVSDANYIRPVFAVLMTTAYGCQSIRDPYDKLILASGHFRQTQKNYIIAAVMNLGISFIAVQFWGLEGVAAGTLAAMVYQMIYMSVYDAKVLLKRPGIVTIKRFCVDGLLAGSFVLAALLIKIPFVGMFRTILGLSR